MGPVMSRSSTPHKVDSGLTINGRHVLFGLLAFFAIVLVADTYLIYKAVSTFGGLETEDAYRKGLSYNSRIVAADAQAKRGWRDQLNYLTQTKRLRIVLLDREGVGVSGLSITASLGRPATNRFDRNLTFIQTRPGIYEAAVPTLESGWWTVEAQAKRNAHDRREAIVHELKRRIWIRP